MEYHVYYRQLLTQTRAYLTEPRRRTLATHCRIRTHAMNRLAFATWRRRGAPLAFLISLRQAANNAILRRERERIRRSLIEAMCVDPVDLVELTLDYVDLVELIPDYV